MALAHPETGIRWPQLWRSFAAKLLLLSGVFIAVPIMLYFEFKDANAERNALLLQSVQEEGRLIASALTPHFERFDGKSADSLAKEVERFGAGRVNIKLLFRPRDAAQPDNFFYIASSPAVSSEYLERERQELAESGIVPRLGESCEGNLPRSARYMNPAGEPEIITSIVPINVETGCWVLVTSHATASFVGSSLGRPYWETPEVRIAAGIYILMAAIVIWLFADAWVTVRRFQHAAREIRIKGTEDLRFAKLNRVPELDEVAEEFDRLVHASQLIRQTAEENTHALKAPLAVISQALEPLNKSLSKNDQKGRRSLDLIERSVVKLDSLVSTTRRMDEAIAELLNPPRRRLDLSRLATDLMEGYADAWKARGIALQWDITPGMAVVADPDLIETALDNLLDNAQSFSPAGGRVVVNLQRRDGVAEFTIEDQGPGVKSEDIERIFERYFSSRNAANDANGTSHFGMGLWIARRNVEAFGGSVAARNRSTGGLRITLRLPLAA